jgi:ankyrin repeat protein
MSFLKNFFSKKLTPMDVNAIIHELSGSTKLHIACCQGNLEEVKFLLSQGADVNTTNKNGATALDLTYSNGRGHSKIIVYAQIAKLLREKGGVTTKWDGPTF